MLSYVGVYGLVDGIQTMSCGYTVCMDVLHIYLPIQRVLS